MKRAALVLALFVVAAAGLFVVAPRVSPFYVEVVGGGPHLVRCQYGVGTRWVCVTGTDSIVRVDLDVDAGRLSTSWWSGREPSDCSLPSAHGTLHLDTAACCRALADTDLWCRPEAGE